MASVVALVADLMFGSRIETMLASTGDEVALVADEARLRARLTRDPATAVLIVDLTDAALERIALVEALRGEGKLAGVRTLGFYSHVDADTRRHATAAGFDLVVARSRMAREGAALVHSLAGVT
jgi:DNA-binding NarL/FixJ family response regulator